MTTLAAGSSITVAVGDGGGVNIATNGGIASAVATLTTGEAQTFNFGPLPSRVSCGPFKEGASVAISNQTAVLDYDLFGVSAISPAQAAALSAAWSSQRAAEKARYGRAALIQAAAWSTSQTFAVGDVFKHSNGQLIVCTTAGAGSVTTEPTFSATAAMADNAAVWWATGRASQSPPAGQDVPTVTDNAGNSALTTTAFNPYGNPTRFLQPTTPNIVGDLNSTSGALSQNYAWLFTDGSSADNGFGANGRQSQERIIEFVTESDIVDMGYILASAARIRVYVSELTGTESAVQENPILLSTTGASRNLRHAFATRKPRLWRFSIPAATIIKNFAVSNYCSFSPPPKKLGLTGLWLSDSYGGTTVPAGANYVAEEQMYAQVLRGVGIRYPVGAWIGGTGYLSTNSATPTKYNALQLLQNNTANFAALAPEVIVLGHGYNDGITDSLSTSLVCANALATWQALRAANPNSLILVLGPWSGNQSATARNIAMDAALQAQFVTWADARSGWHSTITGTTIVAGATVATGAPEAWVTGTGRQGATTGNGNADVMQDSVNGVHPSPIGRPLYISRAQRAIDLMLTGLGV